MSEKLYFKVGPGKVSKVSVNTWNGNYRDRTSDTLSDKMLKKLNDTLDKEAESRPDLSGTELAPYVDKEYRDIITSCKPLDFYKEDDGRIYTEFYVGVEGEIDDDLISYIKEYIAGQCSDGWGEGFEQREFYFNKTPTGHTSYYYSPWISDDSFDVVLIP